MSTNNAKKKYMKRYMREYRKALRAFLVEELGGKCEFCGEKDVSRLEFDHINGYSGKFSPNGSRGGMRNLLDVKRLFDSGKKDEIRLLCKRCNVKRYYKEDQQI